jgi:glycosyltransferase involved in cell wall biosynthesis
LTYLAAGRAVVATRTGAADIDFGDALSVVADGDPAAMAESIAWHLDHEEQTTRKGRLGRARLEIELSWERQVLELERQLLRVVEDVDRLERSGHT